MSYATDAVICVSKCDGGASEGKCEISPDCDCGWELIYNRLKEKNQLGRLQTPLEPLDHNKLMARPEMLATSTYALEQSHQEGR